MNDLIFLMGSERSGSNLITKVFDAHPEICGPNTAHLADSILPELFRYAPFTADTWEQLLLDIHALLQIKNVVWKRMFELRELRECVPRGDVGGLLRYIYLAEARAHGKRIAFVKENRIYEFDGFLAKHFPDARYIYFYRDPRDMAASWKHSYAIRGGAVRAAQTWQRDQTGFLWMKANLEMGGSPQCPIPAASYEELVETPEATLYRLCSAVGIVFDRAMFDYHDSPLTRKNAEAVADYRNISQPIFTKSVGSYRERLTSEEVRYVESVCRETMNALGYRTGTEPLSADKVRQLREDLAQKEPVEKAKYASVSDEEKILREKLFEVRSRIHSRPVPAVSVSPPSS